MFWEVLWWKHVINWLFQHFLNVLGWGPSASGTFGGECPQTSLWGWLCNSPSSSGQVPLTFISSASQLESMYSKPLMNPSLMSGQVHLGRVAILGEKQQEGDGHERIYRPKSKAGTCVFNLKLASTAALPMPPSLPTSRRYLGSNATVVFSGPQAHMLPLSQRLTQDLSKTFFSPNSPPTSEPFQKEVISFPWKTLSRNPGCSSNISGNTNSQLYWSPHASGDPQCPPSVAGLTCPWFSHVSLQWPLEALRKCHSSLDGWPVSPAQFPTHPGAYFSPSRIVFIHSEILITTAICQVLW